MRGNDQGIVKLIGEGLARHDKVQRPSVEKETPATAMIYADLSMEAIAMELAVTMMTRKARKTK
jgi:hypothetical protein